jgi:membrane protease YdiL (CAAX protease family)
MESRLPHTGVIGEWTRDRLEARAALVAGLPSSGVAPEILQRSASAHLRELALTAFTVVLLLSGVGATVFLLRARNGFAEPATQLSAPWRWRDLFGVLMAAQFLGLFLYLGIGMGTSDFVRTLNDRVYIASPLLVLLALTAWLFRRSGLSLAQTFAAGAWKAALSGALALFTFNLLGAVVLFHAFERFGADTEWAESIDEWMIYGSNLDRFVLLLNMAVLAPIYEELQMRRLLHATLRRRLPVLAAAVLSATAFAALHFYSFTGFLAVWWFGFCAALVYERTRSLLACIVGHGLVNVVLGLWDWSSYSVG